MPVIFRFNSRTRVGCDVQDRGTRSRSRRVSIHAPAWGATLRRVMQANVQESVSIHAPAWGATQGRILFGDAHRVSIHAPAWGATKQEVVEEIMRYLFQFTHPRGVRPYRHQKGWRRGSRLNSRTRVGCDRAPAPPVWLSRVSIHAPAWGATPQCNTAVPHVPRFNSRTRVGCDMHAREEDIQSIVSIHAPAWGATFYDLTYF